MENELNQLERILLRLGDLYAELGDLIASQRSAMTSANPAAIEQASLATENLVVRIAELEVQRRDICLSLADRLGVGSGGPAGPRLAVLVAKLAPARARRLGDAGDRLRERMQSVSHAEQVNRRLAEKVRGFFSDLLAQVGRLARETGCYDGKGRKASSSVTAPSGFNAVG